MIQCNLSFPNPLSHLIHIELIFPKAKKGDLEFILPAWRPGRYELADYVQNISLLEISDCKGQSMTWSKNKPNIWSINNPVKQDIRVSYQYYANKMDAGNSAVNNEQVYINFINCILYSEAYLSEPFEIIIDLPNDYSCTTSLPSISKNKYQATDYDELVDSPIIASDKLNKLSYSVDQCKFHVVFMGKHPLDEVEIINDFKAFTRQQIQDMQGFPIKEYYFIVQSLPYKHYHGVEHKNSTVLVLGPNTEENKETYKEMLLGVASHELFHTWNVTRIRPKELSPYNFKQEVLFDTGFVAEGFTTYYGDYFLKTSGVFNIDEYFKEINTLLKRHFENYGRHIASLTDSSINLWVDGYKNISPSKKVSIYVKGALNALIIDLNIRKSTKNKKSLIDVINLMYQKHTDASGGYTKNNVYDIIKQIASTEVSELSRLLNESTASLETYLMDALNYVGCRLIDSSHPSMVTRKTGIKSTNNVIIDLAPDSVAYEHLSIGDHIILIDGREPDETTELDDQTRIKIIRNGTESEVTVQLNNQEHFNSYTIERMKSPSVAQENNFKSWLNER